MLDFRTLLASGETYLATRSDAERRFEPQFEAVYFEGTDTVGHLFMPYRTPLRTGVNEQRYASFRSMVDRYYETADSYLGKLLQGRGDDWTVLVLSDHGFASDAARPLTTDSRIGHGPAADWHRKFGVLVASGKHVRPGAKIEETSVYDIAPTILALYGQPVPAKWPGRILGDLLDPALSATHAVRFRQDEPSRTEIAEEGGPPVDPAAAELREKLTTLGYIGSGDATQVSVSAHNNTGVALMAEGKLDEAVERFRKGLAEQPQQANLMVNLGMALRLLDRKAEAKVQFAKALEYPIARRAAGHQLAQMALDDADYAAAEKYLRAVLSAEPNASEERNTLGLVLEKKGEPAAAETEYLRAVRDDPNAAQPRSNLGNLARSRGDLAGAESWYLQAIEADPYHGRLQQPGARVPGEGGIQKAIDLMRALEVAEQRDRHEQPREPVLRAGRSHERASSGARRRGRPEVPSPLNNLGGVEIRRRTTTRRRGCRRRRSP
jgi:Flp pilus assembly protein TadD